MNLNLESYIREVMDFPKPGIGFKDITPLLQDASAFRQVIDQLAGALKGKKVDKVACVESRGFLFGAALAYKLNAGIAIIRKKDKLPYKTITESYELEYGTDSIEMHIDAIKPGEQVLIVDDLLATGGTAAATARLVEKAGGKLTAIVFLIELAFLGGVEKLKGYPVISIIKYE
jgi:adenine phosphoribosyltransferase